jgi:hypothetical protein
VLPSQPEGLFGSEATIQQDRGDVAQQEWAAGFCRDLAAELSSNAVEGPRVRSQNAFADSGGGLQVSRLLSTAKDAVALVLAG